MSKIFTTAQDPITTEIFMKSQTLKKQGKTLVDDAWEKLFEKYDILRKVEEDGVFYISADQIKEFKEPRLMSKFDSSQQLPTAFKNAGINILPVSRSGYVLGKFKLYQEFPNFSEDEVQIKRVIMPYYETLRANSISSESSAINALLICNILEDFLGGKNYVNTFNGRRGTCTFDFKVDSEELGPIDISVDRAQCEIDAGLENNKSVVIIEAKNVILPDFHIRQLYYPFRTVLEEVTKPIRLVYSVYSNHIFRLYEYRFKEYDNYSSLEFVRQKFYSIEDPHITSDDLSDVIEKTNVLYDDNRTQITTEPPFVQANNFERVISMLECLRGDGMTKLEIADYMQFDERQADYYYNAGRYLGLFETANGYDDEGNVVIKRVLTRRGKEIYNMCYKDRQLALVNAILEHKIFYTLFKDCLDTGIPQEKVVTNLILEYGITKSPVTAKRRASSVIRWLKWIMQLTKFRAV